MRDFSFYLISLVLVIFLDSCKKEATSVNQHEYLLTKQSWTVVSIRQNVNNSGWEDIFSFFADCKKDNRTWFYPDYSFRVEEGPTKCNASDPQWIDYGTWSLSADGKKITTTNPAGLHSEMDIQLLDTASFITFNTYTSATDTQMIEAKYIH